MSVGVGRHIEKTVHKKNTDEIKDWFLGLMTLDCILAFTHYVALPGPLKDMRKMSE